VCMRLIIINNPNLFGLRKIQKWQRLVDLSMRFWVWVWLQDKTWLACRLVDDNDPNM
jgi:hypothetical protein